MTRTPGTLHEDQCLAKFFLEWKIFQTKAVDKIKTQFYVHLLLPENRTVYKIMWKNMAQPERPYDNAKHALCMMDNLRLHTHTHTHKVCNTYWFSMATMVTRTRLNVTLYVHCLLLRTAPNVHAQVNHSECYLHTVMALVICFILSAVLCCVKKNSECWRRNFWPVTPNKIITREWSIHFRFTPHKQFSRNELRR